MIRPLQKFTTQHNKELILMLIRLLFARVSIEIRHNVRDFRQQQKLIEKLYNPQRHLKSISIPNINL